MCGYAQGAEGEHVRLWVKVWKTTSRIEYARERYRLGCPICQAGCILRAVLETIADWAHERIG